MKKKFKLEPHEDQLFLDGNEVSVCRATCSCKRSVCDPNTHQNPEFVLFLQVYVWIYDPVHFKTFAMGLILGESVSESFQTQTE